MTAPASPFLTADQVLAQLRAHGEVTLLDGDLRPHTEHYRDIHGIAWGTINRRYYVQVETRRGCALLPAVFDDAAEAEALYQAARAEYLGRA